MDKQVVIKETFSGPCSGGQFLRKLRKTVQKVKLLHPELANYELYDVGLCPLGKDISISMYFRPQGQVAAK